MCSTLIHLLIHFCQPSGASGASYGQKMAILAPNWPLWSHFHTTGCVILTSFAPRFVLLHVFNCDPPFDPLLPAIWGVWSLLWPKLAILAPNWPLWSHFHTTGCIFLTSFAPRLVLPHVFHCDPPFDPLLPAIKGVWSLLWPKNGDFGPKWATLEPFPHHWVHFSDKFCT